MATVTATLLSTGLVATANPASPIVEDHEHTLSSNRVPAGWTKTTDTEPTQMVGFEWQGRQEGAVEVRARDEGGGWSDWARVEGNPYEGPDVGSREDRGKTTAGPVWVGDTTKVEVRVVEGELDRLKLHAIRSEDRAASSGLKPAGGAINQPGISSRASWGADESWRSVAPGCNGQPEIAPSVRFAVLHHTETSNDYGPGDTPAILRGIYHFHTHTNGWCDIGYNFLVDRHGQVFEGRAGGINRAVIGAHAQNFNTGSTGVSLIGSFISEPVTANAYSSLRQLLAWKLELHGVNPLATVSQNGTNVKAVTSHRDVNPTDCPGNMAYALLPQLRNDLAAAVTLPGRSLLMALHSGKVMDSPGGSQEPGPQIIQWEWGGGTNQQWRLVPLGTDLYKIESVSSGMVLDVAGGSQDNGAAVTQYPWHGGLNQQWAALPFSALTPGGNPDIYVIISMHSGKVLDVGGGALGDGAGLIQWSWQGSPNQIWYRANF